MPGMNSGLSPDDPTLVAAFRSALLHQGLIAAAVFVLLLLAWGTSRNWVPAAAGPAPAPGILVIVRGLRFIRAAETRQCERHARHVRAGTAAPEAALS